MQVIVAQSREVAQHESANVLITGESGCGKEVVAQTIHHASPRHGMPMVIINCAALPENLLESELFGHEKGAFTDAVKKTKGLFEMAEGGTVFLDEIGEMPIQLQAKLLGVLERRLFRRIGGNRDIKTDVKIIAATNIDLKQAIAEKKIPTGSLLSPQRLSHPHPAPAGATRRYFGPCRAVSEKICPAVSQTVHPH